MNEWGIREDVDVLVMDAGGAELISEENDDAIQERMNAAVDYMSENKEYGMCVIKNNMCSTDDSTHDPNENRSLLTINYLYLDIMGGEPYTIARGFSEEHEGIDFASQEGTSIYNACTGTVSDVGYDDSRGNYIPNFFKVLI